MACRFEFNCVEQRLARLYQRYGRFIGHHPLPFLLVPIFVAMGLAAGMVFFKENTDVEYLFTPDDSQAMKDRTRSEELFPLNDDDEFQSLRQHRLGRYGRLILTSRDGGNVLRESVLREILEINSYVLKLNTTDDGERYQFEELCGKWDGTCNQNIILSLYGNDAAMEGSINITYPVHDWTPFVQVFIGTALGGVDFYDDGETVKSAKAMQLSYLLKYDSDDDERRSKAWELEFLDRIAEYESENVNIAYFTSQTQEIELADSSLGVIPLFSITFTVLITFSILCCVMADWVRSKPLLGQLGVLSAGLAVISALGVGSYIGLPFINVVASMPFLVLGIGVDDMFIMIAAWRQTSPTQSVPERMGHAYKEAAMSITITSITDLLAFFIGAITYFPSVRIFCIYTGIAVLFDYAYQITFFGACMTLFGRREEANRHCMTCMKVLPKKEAPSTGYKIFCAGGSSEKTPPNDEDNEHFVTRILYKHYGPFIVKMPVKILTVVTFFIYLGVAIWGCTQLQEGIRLKNLANDDSYAVTFYNLEDEYFKVYGPVVAIVIDEEVDYSDTKIQEAIENVTRELEESDYFHNNSDVTQSWLRDFLDYLKILGLTYDSNASFVEYLRERFLMQAHPYKIDINFNEDNTSILSSRFYVFSKDTNTANRERAMMVDARRIVEKSDIKMFAYHPAFIFYEQYLAVLPNTIQNIGIAAAAMFVVSLILIPHPVCSIYVTFAIATISTGVVGFMTLWDVRLDSISMINIIICIGFSVDFSAHITYAFVIAPFNKRNERAIEALHILGWPIIEGALSTILGVAALAGSESYIFRTFFKTMFLVILIGAVHGLLFLPVFLTLIGPCQPTRGSSPEDALTHRLEVKPSNSYENPNTTMDDEIEEIKKAAGPSYASGMGSTTGVIDETTAVDKGKQSLSVDASSSSVMPDKSDPLRLPGTPSPSESEKTALQNEANDGTTSKESNTEIRGYRSEGVDHPSHNMDAKTNTVGDQVEMVQINKNADSDRHDDASVQIRDRENADSNNSNTDMANQSDVTKPTEKGENQISNKLNTPGVSDSQRKLEHAPDVNVMPSADQAKKQTENATINALTSKYQSESEAENAAVLI
ncbi:patched domain-containing protein 3-like [Ptychodera flava]|uniref:patched domain-containing protein 3-like n=1 Tax=Ptychodera flava TaxID=63121 RepID=UPI00396A90DF